ncbi:hypothetical protein [Actinomadura sp. B10D3]|uniref:hypothetical protein n=1 Tax=Actinomadura sp. B10D3 TaxID=3153557 RepID=UPI00325D43C4
MPVRVRPLVLALMLLSSPAACDGKDKVTMPPLTPEPRESRLAGTPTAASSRTLAARLALYRYLRGIAAGNVKACAFLTAGYERRVFGGPGRCRSGLAQARARLRPQDITALRGVTVPVCETAPDGACTVRFENLRWKGEPARQGGLLAASFTLRKTGAYWRIAA